jgi:hypothetical protein
VKYLDNKAFMVSMPGNKAVQWPRCEATHDGVVCEKEFGHQGKHKGYRTEGDAQFNVEWP